MTREQAFEKAGNKAALINKSVYVYQRSSGRWHMTTRKGMIPRGIFNYRLPLFEVFPGRVIFSGAE